MARTNSDDLLMEDDLAAAFLGGDEEFAQEPSIAGDMLAEETAAPVSESEEEWETADEFPGQLPVDVYETADKLVVKARTAGISKSDLDVSVDNNILTISGELSGDEEEATTHWHIQECYWGKFSRSIALPVPVREDDDSVSAELTDGVLTITFEKEKTEARRKIAIK